MKVIWFSEIKWSYLKTRKQHLIENFPASWEIFFIETFVRGKTNTLWPRRNGRLITVTVPFIKSTPFPLINRILEVRPIQWIFNGIAGAWLFILFRLYGFHTPTRVIFTSNVYFADVLRFFRRRLLVYDCNDYPPGFPGALRTARTFFHKTIRAADLVTVVSDKLREDVAITGHRNIHLVGNGVDFPLFSERSGRPTPSDVELLQHPIIMYVGVLSDWFDFKLLHHVAESFAPASVVLIGPIISKNAEIEAERLRGIPNVHLLGPKAHADLPTYIQVASVCIIPFVRNDLIARFSPNKMYEYLAVGKPVVTMDYTQEIRDLAGVVGVAGNESEFIDRIREALQDPGNGSLRRNIARAKSWQSIAENMVRHIEDVLHASHK